MKKIFLFNKLFSFLCKKEKSVYSKKNMVTLMPNRMLAELIVEINKNSLKNP